LLKKSCGGPFLIFEHDHLFYRNDPDQMLQTCDTLLDPYYLKVFMS